MTGTQNANAILLAAACGAACLAACGAAKGASAGTDDLALMGEKYRRTWNAEVDRRIDEDIERNRKADGTFAVKGLPPGTEVRVEQVGHAFLFGAHSFQVNRTGDAEVNRRYAPVFGELFNAATVPVHWNRIEPEPGCVRWKTEWTDTEAFFNAHDRATAMRVSPCAPLEQTIGFFSSRGVRMVAHPLVWGLRKWVWPNWVYNQYCPPEEKAFLDLPLLRNEDRPPGVLHAPEEWMRARQKRWDEIRARHSAEEFAAKCPTFCRNLAALQDRRIRELAARVGDRIDEWVVVNESAGDWKGDGETGEPVCMSWYGPMPGDYVVRAFRVAGEAFPKRVKFILNDYRTDASLLAQVRALKAKGLRLDRIGMQLHVFRDEDMDKLVRGEYEHNLVVPQKAWEYFAEVEKTGVSAFLSEITLPAPGNTAESQRRQAVVARNLYRLWFSLKPMTGITWWHSLDMEHGGGESSTSGIFDAKGNRKPAYRALDELINHEWRTACTVRAAADGTVSFRGFRGAYRLSWKDADGVERREGVVLE